VLFPEAAGPSMAMTSFLGLNLPCKDGP
jgi:hypothetical protein